MKVDLESASASPHGMEKGGRRLPRAQRWLIFILPVLGCFGPAIAIVGPIFGFRLAVLLLVATSLPWRRVDGSAVVLVTRVLAVIWIIVALLLLLLRGASVYTWPEAGSLLFGILFIVAIVGTRSTRHALRVFLAGWLLAFCATAAVAAREILFGIPFGNYYRQEAANPILEGLGSASTFSNPNNYAFFLLVSFPVLTLGRSAATQKTWKLLYLGAMASVPVLMLATGSRIGLLILIAVGAVFAVAFVRAKWAAVAAGGVALAALLFPVAFDFAVQSLLRPFAFGDGFQLQAFIYGIFEESSMMVRMSLIQNGYGFWLDSYLMGVGMGGFEAAMAGGSGDHPTMGIESPHSGVMEILSQFGILVFAPFALLLITLLLIGWKTFSTRQTHSSMRVGGLLLVTLTSAFPIFTVMNSSFLEPSSSWLFLALLLLVGLAIDETADGVATGELHSSARIVL
ncbi:O-Antigen ligase [Mycetocola miduiensis]|uniref:O-Antigen ligase n=1 Tax=Mycetocola miduiensis TaxID=995034 RepID=A0A1I4YD17_9MICO|nr:O-Antigen ligase [Mycetocola miduiensis]